MPNPLTSPNFVYRPSISLWRTIKVRLSRLGARASLCLFLGSARRRDCRKGLRADSQAVS